MVRRKRECMKLMVAAVVLMTSLWAVCSSAGEKVNNVPEYITAGLQAYKDSGYEEAVKIWLAGSPYESGSGMVSRISFFKNIEMLGGAYQSNDILMAKQTASSNVVYVRMNYERLPGYILFTSGLRTGKWVLTDIKLDRMQRFGVQ